VVTPPGFDTIFLASYVLVLFGSLSTIVRRRDSPEKYINQASGCLAAITALIVLSLFAIIYFGMRGYYVAKYVAPIWIFFSLFFPAGATLNVIRLAVVLKSGGLESIKAQDPTRTGIQHFFVEYSTLRWYRHGYYFLMSVLALSLYFYGWSLFGFPFLLYSIGVLVFLQLLLGSLTTRALSPYSASDVIERIESIYPVRTLKTRFGRPSPTGLIIIVSVLTLAAYFQLVKNAFIGFNLVVFSMLIIVYAISLSFHAWSNMSKQRNG
jgi:hypothetical protein